MLLDIGQSPNLSCDIHLILINSRGDLTNAERSNRPAHI